MSKLLAGVASVGLLVALSLPVPAAAAEKAAGLRTDQAAPTDVSSRRYRRRVVVVRRAYYPRYRYYGGYYPYSYGYGYPYYSSYYSPAYYPRYYYGGPAFSIGFGFGGWGRRGWW